jgi:hypothetical protein
MALSAGQTKGEHSLPPAFAEMRTSFVAAQGSAYARFRRALDSRNVTVAYATATELDFVSLPEALELVLLVVDDPPAVPPHGVAVARGYCGEVADVGFEEAQPCSPAWRGSQGVSRKRPPRRSPPSSIIAGLGRRARPCCAGQAEGAGAPRRVAGWWRGLLGSFST